MKTLILILCLVASVAGQSLAQQTTVVNRWVSPVTKDFMSYPESAYTDQQLISWGYTQKTFQFEAYSERPDADNVTVVNRWTMPNCKESILIAEHEISDAQMQSWGYKDKLFQFYAYQTRPTDGRQYKAVFRWVNAKPQGDSCRDFTLTTVSGEYNDAQLRSWGYSEKRLQFYVPVF
ncbi:MAG: hypothetical protein EAZ70_01130 [Runella slithyformis]|nr:MAG: hypothetical protein EAZ70_01130 [Runella slithyformis]TAF48539.1 MAG: hypothetical protein EAZ63_04515 [Runella slithyformis]TAF83337.1 MAG: hypothetical protein EAZ50_01570 [Runella slithyformis]